MVLTMTTEHSGEEKTVRLRSASSRAAPVRVVSPGPSPSGYALTDPVTGPAADRPRRFRPAAALRASTSRVRPVPAAFHPIVVPADRDVRRVRPGHAGVQPFDERSFEERARSPLPGMARQARRVRRLRPRRRNPRRRAPSCHRCRAGNGRGRPAGGDQPACDYAGGRSNRGPFSPRHASGCSTSSLAGQRRCDSPLAYHFAAGTGSPCARRPLGRRRGSRRG